MMNDAWWEEYPRAERAMSQLPSQNESAILNLLQGDLGLPSGVAFAFYDKYINEEPALGGRKEFPYQEKKLKEGRKANALKMLSQMHAYLVRYNDLDKTEEHFKQRVEELGGTDLYAIVDAVLDVVETAKKADKARMLRRVYRKYFPRTQADDAESDQEIIQDLNFAEANADAKDDFIDYRTPQEKAADAADYGIGWPEEISMRTASPDEEGGEGDYFADDDFEMDEPDFDHSEAYKDDIDIARRDGYFESVEAFVDGEDEFSMAYDDADEFLNEGWSREQVEVYLMDNYKSLSPEDINEIIDSVPRVHNASPDFHDQDYEHPVEEF